MDDTCTIMEKNVADELLDHLNSVWPTIKFTMDLEKDGALPFLDSFLQRKQNGRLNITFFTFTFFTFTFFTFNLVWNNEYVPTYWREGLIVSLFKKGDREDPGNYRGITLLSVIGKLYSFVISNHLLKYLELNNKLHKGRGF